MASTFIPQVWSVDSSQVPSSVNAPASLQQQQQQQPNLPSARSNPKTYIVLREGCYSVINLEDSNQIEFARTRNDATITLGKHGELNIRFSRHPKLEGVFQNEKGNVLEYVPQWFFLDDNSCWSPMSPHMCSTLCAGKNRGDLEGRDSERTYNMVNYNQVNRESGRVRPLLYLRDDGSAVRGECMAMWAYKRVFRGALATATVNFKTAEQLERAFISGQGDITIEVNPPRASASVQVKVALTPGSDEHEGKGSDGAAYPVVRFFPTWFYLTDDMTWSALDFAATVQLDASCAYGFFTCSDNEREYDLLRLLQINLESKKIRPLIQVRGHIGASVSVNNSANAEYPEVYDRANIVLRPQPAQVVFDKLHDLSIPPATRILYFLNALVHQWKFVVKGGILRDAVVKNDISLSHDIDVEIPGGFVPSTRNAWVDDFLTKLAKTCGVIRDPAVAISTRATTDIFGPSGARTSCADGMLTIPVILPGGVKIDIECVTPWNTAYSPPRNIDVSVNNLRITNESKEMGLNVQLPYETAAFPSQKRFFTLHQTIKQIMIGEASPSYDYKWVAGEGAKSGEGRDTSKWVVGFHATSNFRSHVMDERFIKMRSKGYRFVEGP